MASSDIFTLGLGLTPPWRVIDQRLETDKQPNELHLAVAAEPGARFPCPTCGRLCKPHDWKETELAAPQLLPARLHHLRPRAAHRLPRPRRAAHQRALGTPRQRLHPAVRAGRPAADARDAGLRRRPHHRCHRPAALAHPAVLCPPGHRAARSAPRRGRRARRDRRQARPGVRHGVHRSRRRRASRCCSSPRAKARTA